MSDRPSAFWATRADEAMAALEAAPGGLTSADAAARLRRFGPNTIVRKKRLSALALLLAQFRSPIIVILIAAAVLSAFLRDPSDAAIIIVIVLASGVLTFWQERGARDAVEKLLAVVRVNAQVLRDGVEAAIPHDEVVPGDIIVLSAGATIPADCLLLESTDLFVDEGTHRRVVSGGEVGRRP